MNDTLTERADTMSQPEKWHIVLSGSEPSKSGDVNRHVDNITLGENGPRSIRLEFRSKDGKVLSTWIITNRAYDIDDIIDDIDNPPTYDDFVQC